MRTRKKSPIFTAKTNGQVIRRTEVTISTHNRVKQILNEIGGDSKQLLRDLKWERICRQANLSLWDKLSISSLLY